MKRVAIALSLLLATGGVLETAFAAPPRSAAPAIELPNGSGEHSKDVPDFNIAPGYRVTVAIDNPPEARFMEFDNFGTMYLSAPKIGNITSYKLQPDGSYKKIAIMDEGKKTIHCMHFYKGWLWYTTSGGIFKGKVRQDASKLDEMTTIAPDESLPHGGGHWWRPILVDDDGFYTGMGDPQNLSDQTNTDREKIWRYSLDGKTRTLFCAGIRNTEKYRFRPGTTELWGLDHGSDWFGVPLGDDKKGHQPITDNIPGEEVNHYEKGKFYGHPFLVDNNIPREEPQFKAKGLELINKATPPAYLFPAHWANCGWTWLSKDSALGKTGDMYVASHGSWNSSKKVGYCVAKLEFDANGKPGKATEIVGCLNADASAALGRPVDVVEEPNTNNLLFSVDGPRTSVNGETRTSRVYRLVKEGK